MSGLRDTHLTEAYRLLHGRGVNTTTLAAAVQTSRAYVSRVLSGYERHGPTWRRILTLLTPEEVRLLEQVPAQQRQQTPVRRPEVGGSRCGETSPEVRAQQVGDELAEPINPARPTVRAFTQWRNRKAS